MVKTVTLTIDHKSVTVPEDTTILEAARKLNIHIPTLCYLKDINEIGACRICCVEVEGMARLVPACDNVVADGMVVFTNSAKAREARRMNLRKASGPPLICHPCLKPTLPTSANTTRGGLWAKR